MYRHELFIQTNGHGGAIHRGLLQTATSAQFDHMLAVVAYATEVGCQCAIESFKERVAGWRRIRKEWLISIDYGLTEPAALEFLASLPNSIVRVPNAQEVLNARLHPVNSFHGKFYVFDGEATPDALGIFSGSANLTLSGLHYNDEQGISSVWIPPLRDVDRHSLQKAHQQLAAIDQTLESASQLNGDLLARYQQLWQRRRERSRDDNDFVRRVTEPTPHFNLSKAAIIAAAPSLWVDVRYVVPNRGQGLRNVSSV